ncbi:hypothetical protein [Nonomuraea maritima]|uniref:hypothetical protein n=1 Tax=Nonomuraea maritima TaxID=683260 RepID=UPI003716613C
MDIERAASGAENCAEKNPWTLLPVMVVRNAGSPWDLVLSLAYPRAAEAAGQVARLERRAQRLLAAATGETTSPDPTPPPGEIPSPGLAPASGAATGSCEVVPGAPGGGRLSRGTRGRLRDLRPLPPRTPGSVAWLADWNQATRLLEEARAALAGAVSGDAPPVRAAVAAMVTDERFLDALVRTSPGLYRDLRHGADPGKVRRQLASRAQRLSTSSGTCGCFGPVGYGAVERAAAPGYTWQGPYVWPRRAAFPSARVVEALQQRVLTDPALLAGLVPRRTTWTGDVPDGAAFVAWCDGRRTLAEIAAETGIGMERAAAALAVAARRGLLVHDLCPPAGVCDPLGWLHERLAVRGVTVPPGTVPQQGAPDRDARPGMDAPGADAPVAAEETGCASVGECGLTGVPGPAGRGRAGRRRCGCGRTRTTGPPQEDGSGDGEAGAGGGVEASGRGVPAQRRALPATSQGRDGESLLGRRVGEIAELLGQYPVASPDVKLAVQRRIEALAGGGPGDGRVIVHEAVAGTLRVTAGGGLAADLRGRVPRVLDLLAEDADRTRRRANRQLAGRLGRGTFPLAEALRTTGELESGHADPLSDRLAALVRDAPDGVAELDLSGLLDEPAAPAAPVLCTADVLVAASSLEAYEEGVTPLVVGGLHDTVLLTPWSLQFHEQSAARLAERDAAVERALDGFTVLNVVPHRSGGAPPPQLPGPVLELGGVAAGRSRRIGLDELYVRSDGRCATLHAQGMDEPLLLHDGEHATALNAELYTALSLPAVRLPRLPDLPHVPRLTWGNVVVARRRWSVGQASLEALGRARGDGELLVEMARVREAAGLPVTFFAGSSRRRKPFYVDTRSPALIEALGRLGVTAGRLTLTETLPGPEECWLRDGEQRFAAEFRCVYLRPAASRRHSPA